MINEFIEHLNSELTTEVLFAWTSDPIEDQADNVPVIMVYPGDRSGEASGIDNFVRQRVTQTIVCILGCSVDDYETERDALEAAALGWVLDESDDMQFVTSETLGIKGGYIWSNEIYSIPYHIKQS